MATTNDILSAATKEIGVTESPSGSNNVKYNTWYYGHAVSGSAYPWCMAFVQWAYNEAGAKLPCVTASCSALLSWYTRNKPQTIVSTPEPGDIVIYNFGHCGIIESSTAKTITAIEGNTSSSNKGSQSNGGGVFRRVRNKSLVTAYIRALEPVKITPTPTIKEEDEMVNNEANYTVFKQFMGKYLQEIADKPCDYSEAVTAMDWAAQRGYINGGRPKSDVKREELAIVLKRVLTAKIGS